MAQVYGTIKGFGDGLLSKGQGVIDSLFPPEKRAELLAKLQAFAVNNPKLSAFLLSNLALTGLPLLMFIVFTITVFVFSLVAALLIGLVVALLFTVFMVGVALLIVLPTLFITTMGATFLFLWGLGGYYILKWFNDEQGPAPVGGAIGDKLNSITGGRLDFLMDGSRNAPSSEKEGDEKTEIHGDESDGAGGVANGTPAKGPAKGVSSTTESVDTSKVTNTAAGAQKKVSTTAGTAKGGLSGATGLG